MAIPPSTPPPDTPKDFDEPAAVCEPLGRTFPGGTFDRLAHFRADPTRASFEYVSDEKLSIAARDIFTSTFVTAPAERNEVSILTTARRVFGSVAPPSVDTAMWINDGSGWLSQSNTNPGETTFATLPISKPANPQGVKITAAREAWDRMAHAVLDFADAWADQHRAHRDAEGLRTLFYNAFRADRNRPRQRPRRLIL